MPHEPGEPRIGKTFALQCPQSPGGQRLNPLLLNASLLGDEVLDLRQEPGIDA